MMNALRSKTTWSLIPWVGLLGLMYGGTASAVNEANPKPVLVTNDAGQPVPVDLQGSTGIHGRVRIENTPLPVQGDVNVTNASLPVAGTVEVGNFPGVQDVRVTNTTQPVLVRGFLPRETQGEGPAKFAWLSANIVLTDLVGYANGEGCPLSISERRGVKFEPVLRMHVEGQFSEHFQSGIHVRSGGDELLVEFFCEDGSTLTWTGYEI